jgi:hypothetical protein
LLPRAWELLAEKKKGGLISTERERERERERFCCFVLLLSVCVGFLFFFG